MLGYRAATSVMTALAMVLLLEMTLAAPVAARGAAERVWGNGTEWQVRIDQQADLNSKKTQPFYVIGAIDPANPQSAGRWGFGPHDSVMNVRPRHGVEATGACAMVVVVPGPNGEPGVNIDVVADANTGAPLVRAADVNGDGVMEPLTSVATVRTAAGLGLVALFQPAPGGIPIAFTCPVRRMVQE